MFSESSSPSRGIATMLMGETISLAAGGDMFFFLFKYETILEIRRQII